MYIFDYLKKKDFHQAANTFKMEAKVPDRPVGKLTNLLAQAVHMLR